MGDKNSANFQKRMPGSLFKKKIYRQFKNEKEIKKLIKKCSDETAGAKRL